MLLRIFGGLTAVSLTFCLVWWVALGSDPSSALSIAPLGLIVFGIASLAASMSRAVAWRAAQRTTTVALAHPNVALHEYMADSGAVLVLRRLASKDGGRRIRSLNGAYVTVVIDQGSLWIYAGASGWLAARVGLERITRVEPTQISNTRGTPRPGVSFQIAENDGQALSLNLLPVQVTRGALLHSTVVAGGLASIRTQLETGAAA